MKEKKEELCEGCYVYYYPEKWKNGRHIGIFWQLFESPFYPEYWEYEDDILEEDILGHLPTFTNLLVCLWDDYCMWYKWLYDWEDHHEICNIVSFDWNMELHEQPESVLDEIIILLKEQLVWNPEKHI